MKIGQKVTRIPVTFQDVDKDCKPTKKAMIGTVVYIHPRGRFHTVAFRLRGGFVRECFAGTED